MIGTFDGSAASEAIGFARGIWVFWKKDHFDIEFLSKNVQMVNLAIRKGTIVKWVLSAVYHHQL